MKLPLALALAIAVASPAFAASNANLSIVISSPPSTGVTCPINYPTGQTSFVEPVAVGAVVATCTVAPSSWQGALALSGADAGSFALSGMNVVVGSSAITVPKTYNITITATP